MQDRSKEIHVACACSDSYAPYCGAMIASLFHHNRRHSVHVYILSSNMSDGNIEKFETLAQNHRQVIKVVNIESSHYKTLPIGENFTNISVEAYYRLSIPSLFPDLDRIIYLDCDIIVNSDLLELWTMDIANYAMACAPDTTHMQRKCLARLQYPKEEKYFNSGVGLYNISYLRQMHFEEKALDFIANHSDLIVFHDQDIINSVCHGKIYPLSIKWNFLERYYRFNSQVDPSQKTNLHIWRKNPAIIHYASLKKPWFIECTHPLKHLFWDYIARTPWNDLRPKYKYQGWDRWTKYYLKMPLRFFKCQI